METERPSTVNGTVPVQDSIPELREPLSPPPSSEAQPEVSCTIYFSQTVANMTQPEKDAEGFTVPPSAVDAITEAEREAGL